MLQFDWIFFVFLTRRLFDHRAADEEKQNWNLCDERSQAEEGNRTQIRVQLKRRRGMENKNLNEVFQILARVCVSAV